ncbi:MAG: GNAT family N-acetyltransferase [Rhodospirillales bacterium]|nr:GNAT family N-acetyltransferase [Rhodospirillales bacterium]
MADPVAYGALELEWGRRDAGAWESLFAGIECSSLEQSWAYGEALARVESCRVHRAVVADRGRPLAVVQAFEKGRFLPVTPVRIQRGPLWLVPDPSPDLRRRVFGLIKRQFRLGRRKLLVWSPELPAGAESQALMRSCGMRQMVTGHSTALLDLTKPAEDLRAGLHGKWRNALTCAERSGLSTRLAAGGRTFDWLVDRCDSERRRRGFVGTPGNLVRALAAAAPLKDDVLVLTAAADRERLAGVLLFRHGNTATYLLGWNSPEGRRHRAHNLLLWRAVLELRERQVGWLDLGGVNPAASGVARFKLGMSQGLRTLAGTFI